VLRVISGYPGDPQPVFQAMLKNAVRLCDAEFGNIYHWDGDTLHLVATQNAPPAFAEARRLTTGRPGPKTPTGRMIANKKVVHIADLRAEKAYADRDPWIVTGVELGRVRTVLIVPMLKENELIGAFSVYRQKVQPFSDKQIELSKNFAAQAVIAIENARLLNELRQRTTDLSQRTADLSEALEQQTATSEVLKVVSSSPSDLQPVFEAMLDNATRICQASLGTMVLYENGGFRHVALHGAPAAYAELRTREPVITPKPAQGLGRLLKTKQVVHIADIFSEPPEARGGLAELAGARTLLIVPMLKEEELVGSLGIYRQEAKPFTDKQIALLQNFAAQAVIAIENARLLNELRQRTTDLSEALEQQTAAAEVLQVISRSPGELDRVFAAMLENAVRICRAKFGNIYHREGDALHLLASHNTPAAYAEHRRGSPLRFNEMPESGRQMITTREPIQVNDILATPEYVERNPAVVAAAEVGGIRTILNVPMLKEDELVGALIVSRQEVLPFTDKQIALVQNFAAQAVIAIENTRLLNELRQSLEQQTATSQVLQVISTSPGDLEPVFTIMLEKAVRICDASFGNIFRWDGEFLNHIAAYNTPVAFLELRRHQRIGFSPEDPVGRMVANKNVVHTADLAEERGYVERSNPGIIAAVELGGIRTHLVVPMLKDDELIGTFHLSRQEVRPFTDKQIALVHNFAAQAVIAIESTRLLKELRDRTEQVEKLNQHLEQRVTDQVGEIERMGRLRRFLPPQVADLIVASGSEKQLESHRREITALFCDLRGFTGFTESADAEDVMALLRDYHAAIGEIIIKYNGTLERYAGDGVMVVFNDPVPVENPALQAVLMALELREAIGALTATWCRLGHEIGFGIGIAHGFATLGTIGFEGRFDYAAIGTVSNVASRLCDEAKPGQILISPRVLMKVEKAVKVEPVGEFELKGIRRPLAAYNVVAAA
jgi:GAF domain-containing protein